MQSRGLGDVYKRQVCVCVLYNSDQSTGVEENGHSFAVFNSHEKCESYVMIRSLCDDQCLPAGWVRFSAYDKSSPVVSLH